MPPGNLSQARDNLFQMRQVFDIQQHFHAALRIGGRTPHQVLLPQMRSHHSDELARSNDLRFLPELWEVSLVSSHQIISLGVGAFEKDIVIWVAGHVKLVRRGHKVSVCFDELQKLLLNAFADAQFRARQYIAILRQDRIGYIESGGLDGGEQKYGPLQSIGFQRSRYEDIGIKHQPEREHYGFRRSARAALMTWSIWREVRVSVPLRTDSSPKTLKTSGSGAARRT